MIFLTKNITSLQSDVKWIPSGRDSGPRYFSCKVRHVLFIENELCLNLADACLSITQFG